MKKLLRGIVDFRQNVLPQYRDKFAALASGQSPDALMVACSDSRVVPNLFASTDPGDLFVVRNVGNLVPCCDHSHDPLDHGSEGAAIEFALRSLKVRNVIICGHSRCGAMEAVFDKTPNLPQHLNAWLRHAQDAFSRLENQGPLEKDQLSPVDQLSQLNVLQQIEHLKTYQVVQERLSKGNLSLHAWWFDIATGDVYAYDTRYNAFRIIEGEEADYVFSTIGQEDTI
jgi:carbonic anhydrase